MDIKTKVVDDFVKAEIGLKDGGDIIATCKNCEKPLFKIVKVKDEDRIIKWGPKHIRLTEQKYQSNCPYCGSKSWIIKSGGTLIYAGIDDATKIDDADMSDPENGVVFTTLEVSKYG